MSGGKVHARQAREFDLTDGMPPELRECVHEFGFVIVDVLMRHGVKKPGAIREIVREIWEGARQPSQRLYGGVGASAINKLDWVLLQSGCPVSAKRLVRVLGDQNFTVAPNFPTAAMLQASLDALDGRGFVSKTEKHRTRLTAALKAARDELSRPLSAPPGGSGRTLADATPTPPEPV